MSPLARRVSVAAMLAGLAGFGGGGCVDVESMIFIRQVNLPKSTGTSGSGCIIEPNPEGPFIAHGVLDVAFRREYIAGLVVGSQIVTRGNKAQIKTETSRVRIEGIEARVEDARGLLAWGPYTIPATGFIDPAVDVTPSYGAVDATLIGADFGAQMALALAANPSRTGLHFTSISRVFGHTLGGQSVQSGEFHFPITVCYGCLIVYPAEANDPKVAPNPNCDLPQSTGSSLSAGCTPGQDEQIDCRVCKASFPNDPICEPPVP
jgi:hypothetical protein